MTTRCSATMPGPCHHQGPRCCSRSRLLVPEPVRLPPKPASWLLTDVPEGSSGPGALRFALGQNRCPCSAGIRRLSHGPLSAQLELLLELGSSLRPPFLFWLVLTLKFTNPVAERPRRHGSSATQLLGSEMRLTGQEKAWTQALEGQQMATASSPQLKLNPGGADKSSSKEMGVAALSQT